MYAIRTTPGRLGRFLFCGSKSSFTSAGEHELAAFKGGWREVEPAPAAHLFNGAPVMDEFRFVALGLVGFAVGVVVGTVTFALATKFRLPRDCTGVLVALVFCSLAGWFRFRFELSARHDLAELLNRAELCSFFLAILFAVCMFIRAWKGDDHERGT